MVIEQIFFYASLTFGRMLRAGRYSKVTVVQQDGEDRVRKQRAFYAPLLISIGGPLVKILDTGMRVLPQREWEEREQMLYRSLYATSIQVDGDGVLVLPRLHGKTLATLLEDPRLKASDRNQAIELAVIALAEFHRAGFTHGDAMAENVMIDLEAGVAHWFDFETVHDSARSTAWRRADDVRALLATCLLRTPHAQVAGTLHLILDVYGDEEVTRLLAASFNSVWNRPLTFHLGQAGLSFQHFREIGRFLRDRR